MTSIHMSDISLDKRVPYIHVYQVKKDIQIYAKISEEWTHKNAHPVYRI